MKKSRIKFKSLDEFILASASKIFISLVLSYIFNGVVLRRQKELEVLYEWFDFSQGDRQYYFRDLKHMESLEV